MRPRSQAWLDVGTAASNWNGCSPMFLYASKQKGRRSALLKPTLSRLRVDLGARHNRVQIDEPHHAAVVGDNAVEQLGID